MCLTTLLSTGISSGMHLSGIGSYMVKGFQSGIPSTSFIIDSALEGEHMKWRCNGRASLVPSRSLGVNRIRSVMYSKLPLESHK